MVARPHRLGKFQNAIAGIVHFVRAGDAVSTQRDEGTGHAERRLRLRISPVITAGDGVGGGDLQFPLTQFLAGL